MPRLFQGLVLLLVSAQAIAAPVCESAAVLRTRVRDCEGNIVYGRAAKACLEAFDAEIAAARGKVAEAITKLLKKDGSQSGELGSAKAGYNNAVAALKKLADRGSAYEKQVKGFKNEVVWPDDFGSATAAGLPAEDFLRNQTCYDSTQKLVRDYAELIALSRKELLLTAEVSEELGKRALKGGSGLESKDLLPLLQPKVDSKESTGREGPPKANGKSDISGTQKNKSKK